MLQLLWHNYARSKGSKPAAVQPLSETARRWVAPAVYRCVDANIHNWSSSRQSSIVTCSLRHTLQKGKHDPRWYHVRLTVQSTCHGITNELVEIGHEDWAKFKDQNEFGKIDLPTPDETCMAEIKKHLACKVQDHTLVSLPYIIPFCKQNNRTFANLFRDCSNLYPIANTDKIIILTTSFLSAYLIPRSSENQSITGGICRKLTFSRSFGVLWSISFSRTRHFYPYRMNEAQWKKTQNVSLGVIL